MSKNSLPSSTFAMSFSRSASPSGLARTMMRELEAILSARGFTDLSLHARKSAVGFYEKLGYEAVGEEFTEITIPHRKMVKRLEPVS